MRIFFVLALFFMASGCSAVDRLTAPEPVKRGDRLVSAEDFVLSELLEQETLQPGDNLSWYRDKYGMSGAGRLEVVTPPWQVADTVVWGRDGRTFLTDRCAVVRRVAHDPRTGTEIQGERFIACRTFRQIVGPTPDRRSRPWRAVLSAQLVGHTTPAEKETRRDTTPPAVQQEETLPPPLRIPDWMFEIPLVPGGPRAQPRERPVWDKYPARRWQV
jgi:hypothetical protein